MRKLAIALLVVGGGWTIAPSAAAAAVIGQFSWGGDDLFGPVFGFESLTESPPSFDLYLDLVILTVPEGASDPGPIPFNPEAVDDDFDGIADRFLSQLPLGVDLVGFGIAEAFLRATLGTIFLLDADGNRLVDAAGAPLGLTGFGTVAEVEFVEPPTSVPEPGTILLVAAGLVSAFARRRGFPARR